MQKALTDLVSQLFSPVPAVLILIALGIFTVIYTAAIKFFFDWKLRRFEIKEKWVKDEDLEKLRKDHAIEIKALDAKLATQNQVLVQNLQAEHNRALKELEIELIKKNQADLQKLQAELSEEHAERQARRDYEYEARKRLYQECEPLIFQFVELSENALYRIHSLARSAKQGNLPDWLYNSEYYISSTMYHLFAPTVVYKLIQRRLTIMDLKLDRNIDDHYQLSKQVAWSFTADFELARELGVWPLSYDPNHQDWEKLIRTEPSKYWRQGLAIGRFDNAVESLIVPDSQLNGPQRIMSFGEFESALSNPDSTVYEAFSVVRDIVSGFHPETRPVLWRMLITQAHIYDAIVQFHKDDTATKELIVGPIPKKDRNPLYWRKAPSKTVQQQLDQPFNVAEYYLKKWLGRLFQSKDTQQNLRQRRFRNNKKSRH